MKTATKITLATATALAIGLGATVHAFGPGGYGPGAGSGYGPRGDCPGADGGYGRGGGAKGQGVGRFNQQRGARLEQRLAQVEPLLNLTEAQRPVWEQFTESMKARAEKGMELRGKMRDLHTADLSLADRADQRVEMMSAQLERMKGFADQAKQLDAVLTDEQRATLAEYIGQGPRGGFAQHAGQGGGRGAGKGYGKGYGHHGRGW